MAIVSARGHSCSFHHLRARGSLALMKDQLVRFGVALESSLLLDLDAVVRERGGTRSELLRDLARAEVGRRGDHLCCCGRLL